jgi:putative ABC transport system permease protein
MQLPVFTEELRFAGRRLARAPLFSSLTLATLTVGSAACLTVFAIIDGVLLSPLPYDQPDQLVAVFTTEREGAEIRNPSSAADFLDWQKSSSQLATLAAAQYWNPSFLAIDDGPTELYRQKIVGLQVSDGLLPMLAVEPLMGRWFGAEDGADTVVVSHRTWQRRLGASPDVVGSRVSLGGSPYTVVGVMPERFGFPPFWATDAELWVPLRFEGEPNRGGRGLRVFGRLAAGTTLPALQGHLANLQEELAQSHSATNRGTGVRVEPLKEPVVTGARAALLVLAAGAALLLTLMVTNLAGLLLARGLERRRASATQLALGASRLRLVASLLSESLLLTLAAGVLGSLLATLSLRLLKTMAAGIVPRLQEVELSASTCVAASLVLVALGLVVSLVPALRIAVDVEKGLSRAGGRFERADLWRRVIVSAEVAITTGLLLLAGWVGRSFDRLSNEPLGFEVERVTAVDVDFAQTTGDEENREVIHGQLLNKLVDELAGQPGVASVGAVNHLPLAGDLWRGRVFAVGVSSPDDDIRAALRVATPGYFDAMSVRLHAGRGFDASDRADSEPVVMINRSLADTLWPGEDAVGALLARDSLDDDAPRLRVVGVIENVKQESITDRAPPEIYHPFSQNPFAWYPLATVVVRYEGGQPGVSELVDRIAETVPGIALGTPTTLREVVSRDLGDERSRTLALFLFASLAILLATTGLFGVVAFAAHQRRQEIGLRLALGGQPRDMLLLIVKEGAELAALGALVGGGVTLALSPLFSAVLFETTFLDGPVWLFVGVVIVSLTLLASLPPALRASRTDPASVLDRL